MEIDVAKVLRALPAKPARLRVRVAVALREGMTQRKLADAIDMQDTVFSNALMGRRPLLDWQKARVAELLNVPTNVLFPAA